MTAVLPGRFDELAFQGTWRRYQKAAIAAFERDRAGGARRTHLVAPPGSGKTLIGLELVRRLGRRALVLVPSVAVQMRWPRAAREFGATPGTVGPEPAFPIACITYEALFELDDPEVALFRVAAARWAAEQGTTPEAAQHADEERAREIARHLEAVKAEIVRGERAGFELADLLSASAKARVAALRAGRPGAVVFDECHHLASTWGYVVRAALADLGDDVHVVGLTATLPADLEGAEAEVYAELLGPADHVVPTPAVVRDGHLAPYQELAWLTEPLEQERAWLAEREAPLRALLAELGDEVAAPPEGAPAAEWLGVLEAYAARPDLPSGRRAEVAAALRTRSRAADVLVTRSGAKARAMVEIVAAEAAARGDALRALVLCDAEQGDQGDRLLAGVLDPAAGSARHALVALGADARTAPLRPLVVSERGLRCLPADADVLLAALVEQAELHLSLPEWAAEPDGVLVALRSSGAEWVPRAWVELATRVLESGECGVLVGTRGLLGEDVECAALNCLVDLTAAEAGTSVQQMRGRSLRLDPADPHKLASNWDVVCAAPDLVHAGADYARFARRHRHLYAPADDGALEAGPSHAHAELAPEGPPAAARFAELNRAAVERAGARDAARERWRLGEPYRGVELRTVVARRRDGGAAEEAGGAPPVSQRVPLAAAGAGLALALAAGLAVGAAGAAAGLAVALGGLAWAALRLQRASARLPAVLPLRGAARAVAGAYRALGELTGEPDLVPRAAGVRVVVPNAAHEESVRFAAALAELLGRAEGGAVPRVARPLPDPSAGVAALLGRVLRRRPPFPLRHHAVPADLARADERAAAFARAWGEHVGPGRLEPPGEAADGGYLIALRDVWV